MCSSADEDVRWKDPTEVSTEEESDNDLCIPDEDLIDGPKIYLPGSVRCNEELDFVSSHGLAKVGAQNWEVEMVEDTPKDGMEVGGEAHDNVASAVASLTDKWEVQEAQVERRRNRRRKQSAEAIMELDRQQRFNQQR